MPLYRRIVVTVDSYLYVHILLIVPLGQFSKCESADLNALNIFKAFAKFFCG